MFHVQNSKQGGNRPGGATTPSLATFSRGIIICGGSAVTEGKKQDVNLEPGQAGDLWRNTINQIPSTFGRLVYLASLRDPNTGRYQHHGLAQAFGDGEADAVLRDSHERTFSEWLCDGLERQKADLDLYLSSFQSDRSTIVATWIRLAPYRNLIPASAGDPERRLYLSDLEALLEILKAEHDVFGQSPDA
jgi:hypothetical protein